MTGPNIQIGGMGTTNIFISTNSDNVLSWKYSMNNIFYVFDYGKDIAFNFDYKYLCYVETHSDASKKETLQRMSFIGISRIGKYCYENENE